MAVVYIIAGINHFIHPDIYKQIVPLWLNWQVQLVFLSGICEVLFGLLLIPLNTRHIAARAIICLLIALFPANIQMMLNYLHNHERFLWVAILRLPLQFVLIWWAYLFTKPASKNNQYK